MITWITALSLGRKLSPKLLKFGLIFLLAFSVAVGAYVLYNKVWSAGYSTAQVEHQSELAGKLKLAVAKAKARWERSARIAASVLSAETKIMENVNEIISEIPEAVDASDCSGIGTAALRVFNAAITSGSRDGGGETGDPSGTSP